MCELISRIGHVCRVLVKVGFIVFRFIFFKAIKREMWGLIIDDGVSRLEFGFVDACFLDWMFLGLKTSQDFVIAIARLYVDQVAGFEVVFVS